MGLHVTATFCPCHNSSYSRTLNRIASTRYKTSVLGNRVRKRASGKRLQLKTWMGKRHRLQWHKTAVQLVALWGRGVTIDRGGCAHCATHREMRLQMVETQRERWQRHRGTKTIQGSGIGSFVAVVVHYIQSTPVSQPPSLPSTFYHYRPKFIVS